MSNTPFDENAQFVDAAKSSTQSNPTTTHQSIKEGSAFTDKQGEQGSSQGKVGFVSLGWLKLVVFLYLNLRDLSKNFRPTFRRLRAALKISTLNVGRQEWL